MTKKKVTPSHFARPSDAVSTKVKNLLNLKGEFEKRERHPDEALPNQTSTFERPVWDGKVEDGRIKSI